MSGSIFDSALDKIAEGMLDTQCHTVTVAWNKAGYLAAKDMGDCARGLKLIVSVIFAMLASGQSAPE